MKKILLVLVLLLSACGSKSPVEIIDSGKSNPEDVTEIPNSTLISATFSLEHTAGNDIYLIRKGAHGVYSPVEQTKMEWEDDHYEVTLDLLEGTMFEYSYGVGESPREYEINNLGQIMYRTVVVRSNETYFDQYSKTSDNNIEITVVNNSEPLRGVIVEAEGRRYLTMADGKTTLFGVSDDTPITIYTLDNKYLPKTITTISDTEISLEESTLTVVKFKVDNKSDIETLRVAGFNPAFGYRYFQVNNRSFDEDGGQLLQLTKKGDYFEGEVILPIGTVLSYTYTIGSDRIGLEKNEHDLIMRDILIKENMVIEDKVEFFNGPNDVLVTFDPDINVEMVLKVDYATVRFTDSIQLYFMKDTTVNYRYMLSTEGYSSEDLGDHDIEYYYGYDNYRTFETLDEAVVLNDTIDGWLTLPANEFEVEIENPRQIFTGIMMADYWNSTNNSSLKTTIERIDYINPDFLMLSPVWNFSDIIDTPALEPIGQELYSVSTPDPDIEIWASIASDYELAMYQQENPEMLEDGLEDFFTSGAKSDEWWDMYLDEIYKLTIYYAEVAEENNFTLIRIPDTFIGETIGMFSNFDQAKTFDEFMQNTILDIRKVYSGEIYTSVETHNSFEYHFDYLEQVDYLSNKHWLSAKDLSASTTRFREELVRYKAASEEYGVPYFVDQLYFTSEDLVFGDELDVIIPTYFDEMFRIVNENDWIKGVVVFGYPYVEGGSPLTLADDVLKEWFAAFK